MSIVVSNTVLDVLNKLSANGYTPIIRADNGMSTHHTTVTIIDARANGELCGYVRIATSHMDTPHVSSNIPGLLL
jgi:hypothetical protein